MNSRRRDLDKIRKAAQIKEHDLSEELERRAKELREIRKRAEHANHCSPTYDEPPPFDIVDDGVFSARDGKPITDGRQILAEQFYWKFVEDGDNPRGLLHDEGAGAFYLPGPPHELVFSRERCNLACFWWALGDEGAWPRGQFGPERLDPDHAKRLEPWP
jgi:hypothetical protein